MWFMDGRGLDDRCCGASSGSTERGMSYGNPTLHDYLSQLRGRLWDIRGAFYPSPIPRHPGLEPMMLDATAISDHIR
jgi:hypothetical protein